MSYSDEIVLSKFSALNETQEGIVAIAGWVMFHRRYAKRTAELWLQRMRESAAQRKLNLIYLANEVVQQSKAKRREEFLIAFAPIIAEATELAYQSPPDVQQKIKRVIAVWRQRQVFPEETLAQIESRVEAIDKGKPTGGTGRRIGGGMIGGSFGAGGGVPQELSKLVIAHQAVSTKLSSSTIAYGSATIEYTKHMESNNTPPPPVFAARLSQLLKTLDTAHTAVQDAISARTELIRNLEQLLSTNKTALAGEQRQLDEIAFKRVKADDVKQDVENRILSGLDHSNGGGNGHGQGASDSINPGASEDEFKRPVVEALTPPPSTEQEEYPGALAAVVPEPYPNPDLFSALSALNGSSGVMKREVSNEMEGMEELDSDVAEMLRKEAQAQQGAKQQRHPSKRQRMEMSMAEDDDDEYHP